MKTDVEAAQRTAAVLKGLVRPTGPSDARVPITELAAAWDDVDQDLRLRQIQKYRNGKHWPEASSLWELGEALRRAGVPWCSGLWMMWVGGRFGDCAGVIYSYTLLGQHRRPTLRRLLEALTLASTMAAPTRLDLDDALVRYHVRCPGLAREALIDLGHYVELMWLEIEGLTPDVIDELIAIQNDVATYIRREVAKEGWAIPPTVRQELKDAHANWTVHSADILEQSNLVKSVTAIANTRALPLVERETAVISLFDKWFRERRGDYPPLEDPRTISNQPLNALTPPTGWRNVSYLDTEARRLLNELQQRPLMRTAL